MDILLVENNPGDAMAVRLAVAEASATAHLHVARDGEQAMHCLRRLQFDLVILDLNPPKMEGHSILQQYGRSEGAPPFVVFSSSTRPEDREKALLLGAKGYVVKPSDLDEFLFAVQDILATFPSEPGSGDVL